VGSHAFYFKVNLQVKALESFERPGTDHPTTQRHILGAAFLQVYIAVQSPLK